MHVIHLVILVNLHLGKFDFDFQINLYRRFGRRFISFIFILELFAACVALIILTADSIQALFPIWDLYLIKIGIVLFVLPFTIPKSLHFISYTSLLGILALLNLLCIIFYNGLITKSSPGSILQPAPTDIWPCTWSSFPLAFGLIMSGFCGHSVFPSVYKDMKEPQEYPKMVHVSYFITTLIYLLLASAGYAMFGDTTLPEISLNLAQTPSYNPILIKITIWLVALNPITKYPLAINPINTFYESSMQQHFKSMSLDSLGMRICSRTIVSLFILAISIYFPGFHSVMAILGSFFSFTVSVVFPELCFMKLYGESLSFWRKFQEYTVISFGIFFGLLGTIWAFIPL